MRQVGVTALSLIMLALSACALPLGDTEPALALQDIAAGFGTSRLKQQTPAPRRQAISYEINARRYMADLYLSSSAPRAGIVLVPGVVPAGKDDRRLVALATTLARLHFAVLVPDIEGLRRYQVRSTDVQAVADAFRYLSSRPALVPQGVLDRRVPVGQRVANRFQQDAANPLGVGHVTPDGVSAQGERQAVSIRPPDPGIGHGRQPEILIGDPLNGGRQEMDGTIGEHELRAIARVPTEGTIVVNDRPRVGFGADRAIDHRGRLRLE